MTNAIAKITKAELALTETEELFAMSPFASGDMAGYNLIPTKLRVASSGAKAFVDDSDDMIKAPLTGVILRATIQRGLWLIDGEKVPFCSSVHGQMGRIRSGIAQAGDVSDKEWKAATAFRTPHPAIPLLNEKKPLPEEFTCATCPMNAWGSDPKNGRGKACSEKRGLLILPDGWLEPAILSVPTMSLKGWDAYASALRNRFRLPYFGVRTEIDIQKVENKDGQPYGQLTFKMVEKFSDPALAKEIIAVQKQYAELLDRDQAIVAEGEFIEGDGENAEPEQENIPF